MITSSIISSPMCWGNGAHVIHKDLESAISGYRVLSYNPKWTLLPACLPLLARHHRPAIIHTTPDYAVFFKRKNIPLIITFHNYVLDPFMKRFSSPLQRIHYFSNLRWFTQLAVQQAAAVTAVSRFTASLVRSDLGFKGPISVIYDGIDTRRFFPSRRKCQRNEIRVFFSGNLTQRKGAQWLLPIAKKLHKNIRIYYTSGLRTFRLLPRHDRLIPMGRVTRMEMPQRYQEMDILLMPTVREGFGMAVAEAMACGLPVVASNCSSIPELVDDSKGGFLCPVADTDAFAYQINLLGACERLRNDMGDYNREKVKKEFPFEKMVEGYKALFSVCRKPVTIINDRITSYR